MMEATGEAEFDGLRVLIVEDEFLSAKLLTDYLGEMGCQIIGPASSADEACVLIKREQIDAAVLDIRLTAGTSAPVARALISGSAPFVFITGFSDINVLPDDLRGRPVLVKPIDRPTLRRAMGRMLARHT